MSGKHWAVQLAALSLGLCAATTTAQAQSLFLASDWLKAYPPGMTPQSPLGTALPGRGEPAMACGSDEVSSPLSLVKAIDIALCQNPQLRASWAAIKVQAGAVGEAKASQLPTATLSAGEVRDRMGYPGTELPGTGQRTHTLYGNVAWRLFDFGGKAANQRYAGALLDSALANHDAVLQKTLASVIAAYFDVQTAAATWTARQQMETLARQTLETARRREARGAGSQTDTLQATTAAAKATLERSRALGSYQRAVAVLGYSMGLPLSEKWSSGFAAPEGLTSSNGAEGAEAGKELASLKDLRLSLDEWLSQAMERHPALQAARAQVQAARERTTVVQSEGLPTLDATGNLYQNGRPNQGVMPKTRETTLGLSLSIPLFEGFARRYKVAGAQAQLEQKEAELKDAERQVVMELVKAHADATSALNNLDASLQLLDAATQAMASAQRKFDKGAADVTEILNTQTALADATLERIRGQADWRSARLRLFANAGELSRMEFGQ